MSMYQMMKSEGKVKGARVAGRIWNGEEFVQVTGTVVKLRTNCDIDMTIDGRGDQVFKMPGTLFNVVK
ncbi:hypothetical protein PLUTO_00340 [Luteibacter phage vB_LflM-Pluto]|uniref:Uncharacterized protein n=1 Tax=Luteibacter phage vB_LflM-Pluto TaxID=2948611 RepID=A0A9E7MTQ1_9CAUD|nr:hypothetical protein PLUTO_00340 [Luteibacter phage vB_LflM-Pluto]